MTSKNQVERLLNHKWQNPYDVLMLGCEATVQEIKKKFRTVRFLLVKVFILIDFTVDSSR